MKIFKYLALGGLLAMGTTSCEDWLDVNIDEDSPNSSSATVETRLPWIQRWNNYSFGILNFRTSCSAGVYYSKSLTILPLLLLGTWQLVFLPHSISAGLLQLVTT